MATILIFQDKPTADSILKEISNTPFGMVILWAGQSDPNFEFDADSNVVQYATGADGRCAIGHSFCEEDVDWLEGYCEAWITAGQMQILDGMPEDWVYLVRDLD